MKPIHKFNDGRGATLCNECNKMISEGITDDLYCEEHGGTPPRFKYKVTRIGDGTTKNGDKIDWVEWNDDRTFNSRHDVIDLGRSLVLDFNLGTFKWMTTPVTEILENKENYIKFNTQNSTYEIIVRQSKTSIS
jgi:hypothetical protein